jgi:hypothetical protein
VALGNGVVVWAWAQPQNIEGGGGEIDNELPGGPPPTGPGSPDRPSQGLPGGPGVPGRPARPDQGLPGSQPHPGNRPPGSASGTPRPDQGLPPTPQPKR